MTTPADNKPYQIICDAYLDSGKVMQGNAPNSDQLATGMRRLRDLINTWQTQGIKLWVNQDVEVPLVADQATYTLGPTGDVVFDMKPLRVIQAYVLQSSGSVRRPLIVLSWNEYLNLGQAGGDNVGQINSYFVQKDVRELKVTFWLTPDAGQVEQGNAHLLLQEQITNPISLTEDMEFPAEWRMALHWGLADELSTGQPQSIMDRCAQKALMYRTMLEDWDVEDADTYFQPDGRSGYGYSQFR